jgi:hypothetical protein
MTYNSSNIFVDALVAPAPAREIAGDADFYAPLIGSWSVEVLDTEGDGSKRVSGGEWHFSRILEGRGVQDVLIVPAREDRGPRTSPRYNRYGTSLRIFSPARRKWRIHWSNPMDGETYSLTASRNGSIVETSDAGALRWIFSDVANDTFTARAEMVGISADGAQEWKTVVEIRAVRQTRADRMLAEAAR